MATKYKDILLASDHFTTFEILHEISEKAAALRAKYAIKTPDALQIAGSLFHGADKFVTNDADLKKVTDALLNAEYCYCLLSSALLQLLILGTLAHFSSLQCSSPRN